MVSYDYLRPLLFAYSDNESPFPPPFKISTVVLSLQLARSSLFLSFSPSLLLSVSSLFLHLSCIYTLLLSSSNFFSLSRTIATSLLFIRDTGRLFLINEWQGYVHPCSAYRRNISIKQGCGWSLANQSEALLMPADQCGTPLYRHARHANVSSGDPAQRDYFDRR